jgi:hypothetical protein
MWRNRSLKGKHIFSTYELLSRCGASLFLRWKDFLNADLVGEMLPSYVSQVGSLLVVREVCPDALSSMPSQ